MGADGYYVSYECRKCDNYWCSKAMERGCLQKCSKCNSYRAPCTEVSQFTSQFLLNGLLIASFSRWLNRNESAIQIQHTYLIPPRIKVHVDITKSMNSFNGANYPPVCWWTDFLEMKKITFHEYFIQSLFTLHFHILLV